MEKKSISFNEDIGFNFHGQPYETVYIDFEPVPLLPTYSFVVNGKELKYLLLRNDRQEHGNQLDKQNIYKLVMLKYPNV